MVLIIHLQNQSVNQPPVSYFMCVNKDSQAQTYCRHQTYPKNGLYCLQWVRNSGGNSFGNSTDEEDLNRRQLGGKEDNLSHICVISLEQSQPKDLS